MTRRVVVIGGVIAFVLVGGAVVSGAQDSAIAPSDTLIMPLVTTATSSATTVEADNVTDSTAILRGRVSSNGEELLYWFEYSSDPSLGQILIRRSPRVLLITDSTHFFVEADVAALTDSAKYYYRLVIKNGDGTVRGAHLSFNTK